MHDQPVSKLLLGPFHHLSVLLGLSQLASQIGNLTISRLDLEPAVLAFQFHSLGKTVLFLFQLLFVFPQPVDLGAQPGKFFIFFGEFCLVGSIKLSEFLCPLVRGCLGDLCHFRSLEEQFFPCSREKLDRAEVPGFSPGVVVHGAAQ